MGVGHDRGSLAQLPLAAGMASLAGATDVYGLGLLRDLFVSFMSGNTTLLGMALGERDWSRAGPILGLVGLFVAGAAVGAVLGAIGGPRHAAVVAMSVAAILGVPLLRPGWAVPAFVVAMGSLNASLDHVGQAGISSTYVTGTLVKFGQGIGRALVGQLSDWSWIWQAPMWLSLLAGAVAATLLRHQLGPGVLWPLPAYASALGVAALATRRKADKDEAVTSIVSPREEYAPDGR